VWDECRFLWDNFRLQILTNQLPTPLLDPARVDCGRAEATPIQRDGFGRIGISATEFGHTQLVALDPDFLAQLELARFGPLDQ
jgi:hypothetical protein